MAALLHDVGNAVSYQRHHKHSYYLIQNADIPGLTERERELAARMARFHRRTPAGANHADLAELSPADYQLVRKLATLLRLADSLDRSHHQPVRKLRCQTTRGAVLDSLARAGSCRSRALGRPKRGDALPAGLPQAPRIFRPVAAKRGGVSAGGFAPAPPVA